MWNGWTRENGRNMTLYSAINKPVNCIEKLVFFFFFNIVLYAYTDRPTDRVSSTQRFLVWLHMPSEISFRFVTNLQLIRMLMRLKIKAQIDKCIFHLVWSWWWHILCVYVWILGINTIFKEKKWVEFVPSFPLFFFFNWYF